MRTVGFLVEHQNKKDMRYKTSSCHDCLFLTICDNPDCNPEGGYRCSSYEWKYQ
nr:MAG TPA: hypothetical protein [Caudoviricetes sp.]